MLILKPSYITSDTFSLGRESRAVCAIPSRGGLRGLLEWTRHLQQVENWNVAKPSYGRCLFERAGARQG